METKASYVRKLMGSTQANFSVITSHDIRDYPDKASVYPCDVSNIEDCLEVASEIQSVQACDAVFAFDDSGIVPAATIAHKFGIRGNSLYTAIVTTNKVKMRELLNAAEHFESVWYQEVAGLNDLVRQKSSLPYPVIVKPVKGGGSRGVTHIESPSGLGNIFGNKSAGVALPK